MLSRVITAIIVGIVTALVVYLIGILVSPVSAAIGGFLESISYIAGLLAGLWYFFANRSRQPLI